VFTARYALSPYIKQIRFVFKGLNKELQRKTLKSIHVVKERDSKWIFEQHPSPVPRHSSLTVVKTVRIGTCTRQFRNTSSRYSCHVTTRTTYPSIKYCTRILQQLSTLTSGFRRDADEICALLRYNAASNGNPLPTFRDNVSVPSSKGQEVPWPLKMGPIRCPKTSVKDYHSTLRYTPDLNSVRCHLWFVECTQIGRNPCFKTYLSTVMQ
jgi:hypothetical protein